MTAHRPFKDLTKKFSPERRARVTARVAELKAEMALAELRQARDHSQQQLARALKINQPAVAKLEKRTDMYVSNLRRYIEGLGGSLEITATFPEGRVSIMNFRDIRKAKVGKPRRAKMQGAH
jgi:transcriptional regulator with XRE-family HTH domain